MEAGDELVFEGVPFSESVQVVNGAILRYGEDQTDNSLAYLKDVGGIVRIDPAKNLVSNSCTLNGGTINDNTVGPAYYIDEIGVLGSWTVTGGGGSGEYDKIRRRKSAIGRMKSISSK